MHPAGPRLNKDEEVVPNKIQACPHDQLPRALIQSPRKDTMKNLKLSQPMKLLSVIAAVALVAVLAVFVFSSSPESASAANGPRADATFTKWVTQATAFPFDMLGVVGGDVGDGTYSGELLSKVDDGTTSALHAIYHFNGRKHSFTADLFITQSDATGAGIVTIGVVTSGWLKGAQVTGGFDMVPVADCGPTPGNLLPVCFRGALHLGPKH